MNKNGSASAKLVLSIEKQYTDLKPKLDYVVKSFNSIYSLNKTLTLNYGVEHQTGVRIVPGDIGTFFTRKKEIPDYSFFKWDGFKLPVLFQDKDIDSIIISNQRDKTSVEGDILISAFYFLSCWQEYICERYDSMGRFPISESLLFKLDLTQIPVVNYYFDILVKAIESITGMIVTINPKHSEGLKVGVTHDIDHCKSGSIQDGYRQIKAGEWWKGIKKIFQRFYREDIWFNFDQLLKIEEKLNITSTYYFITSNVPKDGYPNADYDLSSPQMKKILTKIYDRGHEIGIHGSIGTGYDVDKLKQEMKQFSNPIIGGRFHYLMMRIPESFTVIEKSGLCYDSSLGFAEQIGFRNGLCFPFYPYDFENEKPYNFLEFPFQMMDKTLIQPYYMGLRPEEAIQSVKKLMDEVKKFSGYFIFIWHNNTIVGFKYKEWEEVLTKILEYGVEIEALFKSIESFYNTINYSRIGK